jgi:hypothetical protein
MPRRENVRWAHTAFDEPLSHPCQAADHGDFIEGHARVAVELLTEFAGPGFDGEAGIVAEAQKQERDAAGGGLG